MTATYKNHKTENVPVPRPTAEKMESGYNEAINLVKQALGNLNKAEDILKTVFVGGEYSGFLPYKLMSFSAESVEGEIKEQAWRRIIALMQLPDFLPKKQQKKLDALFEKEELPPLTAENIINFCSNIFESLPDFFQELIDEVFQWIQPAPWNENYKTNKKWEIGEKAIKNWVIETSYGFIGIRYEGEKNLHHLDTVFHLLDGQGIPKYPGNAVTAIREAIQNKEWEAETPYFHFRWYKKGSLHIRFKRLDLLKKFNKAAGDGTLPSKK